MLISYASQHFYFSEKLSRMGDKAVVGSFLSTTDSQGAVVITRGRRQENTDRFPLMFFENIGGRDENESFCIYSAYSIRD